MSAIISSARQRQQVEEKIPYQALYDLLTGLPNCLQFNDLLTKAIDQAIEDQEQNCLPVMFLDLDRFKIINDTLGHILGDELLQNVAQRIRHSVRLGDIIARSLFLVAEVMSLPSYSLKSLIVKKSSRHLREF
jgi:GGDEF domain-containing protein